MNEFTAEIEKRSPEVILPVPSVYSLFIDNLRASENPESFQITGEIRRQTDLLAKTMFSFPPLNPLPEEEIRLLERWFQLRYRNELTTRLKGFKRFPDFPDVESYVATLLDPEVSRNLVPKPGSRGLDEYFLPIEEIVRKQIALGKSPVKVLDIGSSSARMLFQLGEKPECAGQVETHALSPEPEPHYPVNFYHHLCGEYLPAVFTSRFDVIVSQWALEYSLFPDRALDNARIALASGGEAILEIPQYRNQTVPRIEKKIENLAKRRKVRFDNEARNERLDEMVQELSQTVNLEKRGNLYHIKRE